MDMQPHNALLSLLISVLLISGDRIHFLILGKIYSFDEDGVTQDSYWDCCLSSQILSSMDSVFIKMWDAVLIELSKSQSWQRQLYVYRLMLKIFLCVLK